MVDMILEIQIICLTCIIAMILKYLMKDDKTN